MNPEPEQECCRSYKAEIERLRSVIRDLYEADGEELNDCTSRPWQRAWEVLGNLK